MVLGSSWGAKGGSVSSSPLLGSSPVGVPAAVPPMRRSPSVGAAEGPGSVGAAALRVCCYDPS